MAASAKKQTVLRYPLDAITEQTDYLQILITKYKSAGGLKRTDRSAIDATSVTNNAGLNSKNLNVLSSKTNSKTLRTPLRVKNQQDLGVIYLPMPSNVQDGNSVNFSEESLDGLTASVYSAIVKGAAGPGQGADTLQYIQKAFSDTLTGVTQSVLSTEAQKYFINSIRAQAANIPFGGNLTFQQILAREEGRALNPNMELLFKGPTIRSFKFSFKLTPRNEKEANVIRSIIRTLKESMAPSGAGGTFLETPNVFNLTYKSGVDPQPYLNKFKTCALTDMSVNYTGENIYATYPDGSPISYVLDLGFKELEPIYAEDYSATDNTSFY